MTRSNGGEMIITEEFLSVLSKAYFEAPQNHIKKHMGEALRYLRNKKLRQEKEESKRQRQYQMKLESCRMSLEKENAMRTKWSLVPLLKRVVGRR